MNRLNILCLLLIVSINADDFDVNPLNEFYKTQLGKDLTFYTESGYVTIEGGAKDSVNRYFYHLFLKDGVDDISKVKADDTFILWLGGGPGCSSQYGNFIEIGPLFPTKEGTVVLRDKSWNKFAHLIFVDQPFNVGLSHSTDKKIIQNTQEAAQYFVRFLTKFYTKYPVFSKAQFYITGESFAGHYVPAIGVEIFTQKQEILFNLKGVAIAAGWTFPFQQITNYASYLFSIGVIDQLRKQTAIQITTDVQQLLLKNEYAAASTRFNDLKGEFIPTYTGGMSVYNFQEYYDSDGDRLDDFINKHKEAFKSELKQPFIECNHEIYELFNADVLTSRAGDIELLLKKGLRVLLYSGQLDFYVNTPSALQWISTIKWPLIDQWKVQSKKAFTAVNPATNIVETTGTIKYFDKLYVATIYRAGHLVALDNPNGVSAMIQHFLAGDDWI